MVTVIRKPADTRVGEIGAGLGEGLNAFFRAAVRQKGIEEERNAMLEALDKKFGQQKWLAQFDTESKRLLQEQGYEFKSEQLELEHQREIEKLIKEKDMDLEKAGFLAGLKINNKLKEIQAELKAGKELKGYDFLTKKELQKGEQSFVSGEREKARTFEATEAEKDRQLKRDLVKAEESLRLSLKNIQDKDKRQLELNKQFRDFVERSEGMGEEELNSVLSMFQATAKEQGLALPNFNVENPWFGAPRVTVDQELDVEEEPSYDDDDIHWFK